MPTTQKLQQKQTNATQKVGRSAKKPVTKAMEGGKAAPSKGKMTRGGSAKGGGISSISEKMPVTKKTMNEAINEIETKINSRTDTKIYEVNKTIQAINSMIDMKMSEVNDTIGAIFNNLDNDKQSKIRQELSNNRRI